MSFKYIMFETAEGQKLPVIFPSALTHSLVAGAMQMALDCLDSDKDLRPKQCLQLLARASAVPVSAGFMSFGLDIDVAGESESLGGLKSKPSDAARIVCGDSIAFMPDSVAEAMLVKLKEDKD